ncbi:hypothetical protein MSG28_011717, partial [Choristoneura fumiferana]
MFILRHDYGIFGLGTIRSNRLRSAEKLLPGDKDMKKKPRGNYAQVVSDQKLAIVKWYDNKAVTFISSYVGTEPVEKTERYCKNARAKVAVDCPKVVKEYNKHMGGVDLADMLIALYKTLFKCRRWYMAIFVQMIDICINNAWLLGRHKKASAGAVALKNFRLDVYHGSAKRDKIQCNEVKNPSKPRPVDSVRYDEFGHFPSTKTEGRCCLCKKTLRFIALNVISVCVLYPERIPETVSWHKITSESSVEDQTLNDISKDKDSDMENKIRSVNSTNDGVIQEIPDETKCRAKRKTKASVVNETPS